MDHPKRRNYLFLPFSDAVDSKHQLSSPADCPDHLDDNAYAAFKRGKVVRGILCPSMTNSFKQPSLEKSYLTYTHRQRQKSLLIVNVVDLTLKIILAIINLTFQNSGEVSTCTCNVLHTLTFLIFARHYHWMQSHGPLVASLQI